MEGFGRVRKNRVGLPLVVTTHEKEGGVERVPRYLHMYLCGSFLVMPQEVEADRTRKR